MDYINFGKNPAYGLTAIVAHRTKKLLPSTNCLVSEPTILFFCRKIVVFAAALQFFENDLSAPEDAVSKVVLPTFRSLVCQTGCPTVVFSRLRASHGGGRGLFRAGQTCPEEDHDRRSKRWQHSLRRGVTRQPRSFT